MTFPHTDPDFDIHEMHRAEREAKAAATKMVFDVCNATLETILACPFKLSGDCLECGNEECFKVFEAQWSLWGMTKEEGIKAMERQRIYDKWALIAQEKRFSRYYERNKAK